MAWNQPDGNETATHGGIAAGNRDLRISTKFSESCSPNGGGSSAGAPPGADDPVAVGPVAVR